MSRPTTRWLWLSASTLLLALLLSLGSLFYLVYRDWHDEQQDTLIQESLWLEQALRMHLESHREWADNLSRELAGQSISSQHFSRLVAFYRRENPALVNIEYVESTGKVHYNQHGKVHQTQYLDHTAQALLQRSIRLMRPIYGSAYATDEGKYRFDLIVPVLQNGQVQGGLRLVYQLDLLLFNQVPWWIASKYQVSIQDVSGKTLAHKFDPAERPSRFVHQTQLAPPDNGLYLRTMSYRSGLGLALPLLSTLIVLLSLALWYAAWRIRRQIREQLQAKQALAQEVALRQAIEDNMKSGLVALSLQGEIQRVNRAFCELLGFLPEQLIGTFPPHVFWPAAEHRNLTATLQAVSEHRLPKRGFELRFAHRDGTLVEVRLFATPLIEANGQQRGWIASLFDITEPKRQREALRASHQRLLTVLNGLVAGICVVDEHSQALLYTNPAFDHLWLNTQADGPYCLVLPLLAEPSEHSQEFTINDGQYWFQLQRRRIDWVKGESACLMILNDISEEKQRIHREQAQQERLQNTTRLIAMGEMASSLAHELNQPLTAINTYAAGLGQRLPQAQSLPHDVQQALQAITEQAQRAAQIVSSIRAFVKKHEPQLERTDPSRVIHKALSLIQGLADKTGTRVEVTQDGPPCLSDMDSVLIEQVLLNLMKNAIEAMQEAHTPRPCIQLSTQVFAQRWQVSVLDNGPGVSLEIQPYLFTPFCSSKADGMGIGLNICRSIVEFHRGEFGVGRAANGGARFWFSLPVVG